ncbi:MAG: hypothetical protein V4466_05735 [Pseudomonadota bacterium]
MTLPSPTRINGWKSIGAYFGRDRTTAMRWAQSRGLPVRRIPGGKTATVYALKEELDAWAQRQADAPDVDATEDLPAPAAPSPRARKRRTAWLAVAAVAAIVAAGGIGAFALSGRQADPAGAVAPLDLPDDPALQDLYLQARDDWAKRTPEGLTRAIQALETITERDPRFAPAFSALADAYLLAREFGALSDSQAFTKAKAAAQASLRIDPDLAAAHRAMGFIQYWYDNDPASAGQSFRRALALEPSSAQTHFWFGNVLSDNGAHPDALRELSRARLLEPGSIAIPTDLAWAEWAAGRQTAALASLTRLVETHPEFSVAQECLAIVRLSDADYAGYVEAYSQYARLRGDASLQAHAAAQETSLRQGVPALQKLMMARALDRVDIDAGGHAWPAFLASVFEDRAALLDILQRAEARGETWGSAGTTARIRHRWSGDAEIIALLDRRKPASVA